MTIDTKTDDELIQLWDELTAKMNAGSTAIGATQELRVLSEIHNVLAKRGYKPDNGVWVKAESDILVDKPESEQKQH